MKILTVAALLCLDACAPRDELMKITQIGIDIGYHCAERQQTLEHCKTKFEKDMRE